MLATFLIEIIGAMYIVWRYKMTDISRLIVAILVCLAIFQGAEYMLCGGFGVQGGLWSQVGYSAITLLPPLGIHLSLAIAGKKRPVVLVAAYATAIAFIGYFVFATGAISGHTCYANYVTFASEHGQVSILAYALYYYGWLFVGVWQAFRFASIAKEKAIKSALIALGIGYSAFIIPTTAFNIIDPATLAGIPSIMCGFAVILAFILITKVAPDSLRQKNDAPLFSFKLPL
jgi:hypothetical protein